MNALAWSLLLSALIAVEHPRTPQQAEAAFQREGAVGVLQIRQCCLDDINRIYAEDHLTLADCQSEVVSRWVAVQYLTYWGKHYQKATGKEPTAEVLARCWNGGPNGWQKQATVDYWHKVEKAMKETTR